VIAFAFHPVQGAVQAAARRLVHGARPPPRQVLSAFAHRAGAVTDDATVLADLGKLAADGVGAAAATVSTMVGGALHPPPLDGPLIPVHDRGEQVGAISLSLRPGAEPTPADEALLADLAALAGPVLRATRLRSELGERNTELAASRARLATAATQARRRLERDLHDSAQQRLISVKIRLGIAARAAHRAADGDSAAAQEAAAAVDAALGDADQAIDELRDLVHGIYPVTLDGEGPAAALRVQARAAPLPVTVRSDLPSGLRYPRDIEAAAYFCCLEAIQNATKHARADHVDVHLGGTPARLEFSVTDDGTGFTPGTENGRGLLDLADRAGALGGRVTVTSSPGAGATVSGWIPIP
jgi:signal transduction histidine kinase